MTTLPTTTDPFAVAQAAQQAATQAMSAAHVSQVGALNATITQQAAVIAALTGPVAPATEPDAVYPTATDFYFATAGSDSNPGTAASPMQTMGAAIKAAQAWQVGVNAAKLVGVKAFAADTFQGPGWLTPNNLLFTRWGQTNIEHRPTIVGTTTAWGLDGVVFGWNLANNVHFQELAFAPNAAGTLDAVRACAGDDITLDYCQVLDGFQRFGFCVIGGATNARLWHNWIGGVYQPNNATESNSGLYTEAVRQDVRYNTFWQNGWIKPFNPADAATLTAMRYRHSYYENPGTGAVAGTDIGNIYALAAATGHQGRVGNHQSLWNTLYANGAAVDLFGGTGINGTGTGEIGYCGLFGATQTDGPYLGGGLSGQSLADHIHDCWVAGNSAMQLGTAINIAGTSPTATAAINNILGYWPGAAVSVSPERAALTTQSNVNVVPLPAGRVLPTFNGILGTTSDDASKALLQGNLHNQSYQSLAIIDRLRKLLAAT